MQMLISWARWLGALSIWPLDLARSLMQRQAVAWRPAMVEAAIAPPMAVAPLVAGTWNWATASLTWPFDLARAQHAAGVQCGLLQRSLLASADFERRLGQLERLALGPLARRV
jgi:hypothetical protein